MLVCIHQQPYQCKWLLLLQSANDSCLAPAGVDLFPLNQRCYFKERNAQTPPPLHTSHYLYLFLFHRFSPPPLSHPTPTSHLLIPQCLSSPSPRTLSLMLSILCLVFSSVFTKSSTISFPIVIMSQLILLSQPSHYPLLLASCSNYPVRPTMSFLRFLKLPTVNHFSVPTSAFRNFP